MFAVCERLCGEFLCEQAVGKAWVSELEASGTAFQGSVLKFRGRRENQGKSEGMGRYREKGGPRQGEGLGGEREKTDSVGPNVNTEPEYERVWGRWGEITKDKDDGGKERGRKLGEFIIQTGLVLIFSLSTPICLYHTHAHTGEVEKDNTVMKVIPQTGFVFF